MDKETLEKIGRFSRRQLKEEELYTFPVILCDNEIDRDYERFSDEALEKLAQLYVGKTGIIDHDPSAANQSARIYDVTLEADTEKLTSYGSTYKRLKADAYMVRTAGNKDLIAEIDAGIKKEVSVSCSSSRKICSICGADVFGGSCEHQKGIEYDGKVCYHILDGITDAYEWSFVAVPAQINAGVTKKYSPKKEEKKMENEFKPITTQVELDAAVKSAVDAAVAETEARFEGWISPEDHQKQLDELSAQKQDSELKSLRIKAAIAAGLPVELAEKLSGDDEETVKKDAEHLAQIITKSSKATPKFSASEGVTTDDPIKAAQLEMLADLKK